MTGYGSTRRRDYAGLFAPAAHCPDAGLCLVEKKIANKGVQKVRLRCNGCGTYLLFTVTFRVDPVQDEPVATAEILSLPLPPHRVGVLR